MGASFLSVHFLTLPLCLLSFDPLSKPPLPPQSKRAVCPAMPLGLYLFPSESVCCCFSSLFSLLPLSFSLPVPLCKLSLSPTDLGFKAWHETWLVFSLKKKKSPSCIHSSLRLHASPITRTWHVHPLSVVQIVVYLVCDVSFFSHTYTEHQKCEVSGLNCWVCVLCCLGQRKGGLLSTSVYSIRFIWACRSVHNYEITPAL